MKKTAFSLIEISVIILILGVVIAGISKSSIIYGKYLTTIAKNKTQNSPVSSIEGLVMWFEAATDRSFDEASMQDYDSLSSGEQNSLAGIGLVKNWYDISDNDGTRQELTNSNNLTSPKYKTNCINSLPCVYFDGIDDLLTFSDLPLSGTEFTIFIVEKSNSNSDSGVLIGPTYATGLHKSLGIANKNNSIISHNSGSPMINNYTFSSTPDTNPIIHTISTFFDNELQHGTYSGIYYDIAYEKNNETDNQISPSMPSGSGFYIAEKLNINSPHSVGSGYFYDGNSSSVRYFSGGIGEIIVFNKTLKAEDRKAVQNYLVEKWRIN